MKGSNYETRRIAGDRHGIRRYNSTYWYWWSPRFKEYVKLSYLTKGESRHVRWVLNDVPSYWFCTLDFRLLIGFWMLFVHRQIQRYHTLLENRVACSCFMCTIQKRKWHGNGRRGKPQQQKRVLASMDAQLHAAAEEWGEMAPAPDEDKISDRIGYL